MLCYEFQQNANEGCNSCANLAVLLVGFFWSFVEKESVNKGAITSKIKRVIKVNIKQVLLSFYFSDSVLLFSAAMQHAFWALVQTAAVKICFLFNNMY